MNDKLPPDQAARRFFSALMESQCNVTWSYFSTPSQNKFAEWMLKEVYDRNPQAAKAADLGVKEVKILFENNDSMVMKFFWRRFFFASAAHEIFRLGYFSTDSITGKKAIVRVKLKYPNGQTRDIGLPMILERGGWKLAYVEHNLPF